APFVRFQRAMRLRPDRSQRSAAFGLQSVGGDPPVAHETGNLGAAGVEEAARVFRPFRGDTEDFERLAVIEPSAYPPAGDGDADELAVLHSTESELAADCGLVVPMVLGDECVDFSQVKWDRLHSSI